jgi:hypothetical protein
MPPLDPWVSVAIRAEFLTLVSTKERFERTESRRAAILNWLQANAWLEELGLRLRDPRVEVPWNRGLLHGSQVHWYWTAMNAMYTAELNLAIEQLSKGNSVDVELCLVFLEADPWCDRSGYVKQTIVRHMRKVRLLYRQQERLLDALLIAVYTGPRIEFREYCRTARAVATPEFYQRLRSLAGNPRNQGMTGVEQRALWMLEAIDRPYQS